jgi:hypothetical protein
VSRRFGERITSIFKFENQPSKKPVLLCHLLPAGFMLGLYFYLEDGGDKSLGNIGARTDNTVLCLRKWRHL